MPREGKLNGRYKHGEAAALTAEYRIWSGMLRRCRDENHRVFKFYGGRGVAVCKRWSGMDGFENFLSDVGRRPSEKHSIDRHPNKAGNYEPGNVRWATSRQQQRNRESNRIVEINGQAMPFAEAVERFGKVSYTTAMMRVWRSGWEDVRAITTPLNGVRASEKLIVGN